jgi:ATP-dependent DNA helicase RecQ
MLAGSRSQELLSAGLDRLSTYGILRGMGAGFIHNLMRSLADAGLIVTIPGEYPLVTLTPLGEQVMRGESAVRIVWPAATTGQAKISLEDHGFDPQLYSMLRDLRGRIAKKEHLPPYMIFSNRTLEAIARYRPTTTEEALEVPGIGIGKLQRHAAPFLETVRVWKQSSAS